MREKSKKDFRAPQGFFFKPGALEEQNALGDGLQVLPDIAPRTPLLIF